MIGRAFFFIISFFLEELLFNLVMSYPEKLKNGVKPCSIKLLQINDVYKLDYLPFFKTCKEIESKNFEGTIIACLPGDFLSPSALSGLDHGAGMVACLNQAGVDFVSFGKV